jgi:2-polyprenyl-3-methyl-5-hydroxy-6-metoxy-1,4-benzoquinol methylase
LAKDIDNSIVAKFWDNKEYNTRTRWWQSPTIIQHYNKMVCGEHLDGWNAGAMKLLKKYTGGKTLKTAISVGCGIGSKEMDLLKQHMVEHFVCFDLSEKRLNQAKSTAIDIGINSLIEFYCEDFFSSEMLHRKYDLVFWDNSLHHMIDTSKTVKISIEILNNGGILFCNDYVGASRFQWSDIELAIVNGVRAMLPDELFVMPNGQRINKWVTKPSLESMIQADPSEAADSASILEAIKKNFESPEIINTGGLIYHLCLNDILQNIKEESDMLQYLLQLDEELCTHDFWQYAFIIAKKYE